MIAIATPASSPTTRLEVRPMLFVDCPLCDVPAPFDEDTDALDCPACAVRIVVAGEDVVIPFAAAA